MFIAMDIAIFKMSYLERLSSSQRDLYQFFSIAGEQISSGSLKIYIKYKNYIPVVSKTLSICDLATYIGESCPLDAGTHSLSITEVFPSYAPSVRKVLSLVTDGLSICCFVVFIIVVILLSSLLLSLSSLLFSLLSFSLSLSSSQLFSLLFSLLLLSCCLH